MNDEFGAIESGGDTGSSPLKFRIGGRQPITMNKKIRNVKPLPSV